MNGLARLKHSKSAHCTSTQLVILIEMSNNFTHSLDELCLVIWLRSRLVAFWKIGIQGIRTQVLWDTLPLASPELRFKIRVRSDWTIADRD